MFLDPLFLCEFFTILAGPSKEDIRRAKKDPSMEKKLSKLKVKMDLLAQRLYEGQLRISSFFNDLNKIFIRILSCLAAEDALQALSEAMSSSGFDMQVLSSGFLL